MAGCRDVDAPEAPTTWPEEIAAEVPLYEYDHVTDDARTERLDLVADLTCISHQVPTAGARSVREDPVTFEWQIVRYRVVAPFIEQEKAGPS